MGLGLVVVEVAVDQLGGWVAVGLVVAEGGSPVVVVGLGVGSWGLQKWKLQLQYRGVLGLVLGGGLALVGLGFLGEGPGPTGGGDEEATVPLLRLRP